MRWPQLAQSKVASAAALAELEERSRSQSFDRVDGAVHAPCHPY
jgi:hypothetical protein